MADLLVESDSSSSPGLGTVVPPGHGHICFAYARLFRSKGARIWRGNCRTPSFRSLSQGFPRFVLLISMKRTTLVCLEAAFGISVVVNEPSHVIP